MRITFSIGRRTYERDYAENGFYQWTEEHDLGHRVEVFNGIGFSFLSFYVSFGWLVQEWES